MSDVTPLHPDRAHIVPLLTPRHLAPFREYLLVLLDECDGDLRRFGEEIAAIAGIDTDTGESVP